MKKQEVVITGELECCEAQNAIDRTLLEGCRNILVLHKTASQQRISNHVNLREKLAVQKASPDIAFQICHIDSDSKVMSLQKTLRSETKRAGNTAKESERLFVTVKNLNLQLRD